GRRARRGADRRVSERRRRPLLLVPLQRRGRVARRLPGQWRARARAGRHRYAVGRGSVEAGARLELLAAESVVALGREARRLAERRVEARPRLRRVRARYVT